MIEFQQNHKVQDDKNQQKCQKWLKMAESQGNGLKTAANGLFHKNFEFGPLFWYDNFQNEIDTWQTTVECLIMFHSMIQVQMGLELVDNNVR